MSFMDHMYKCHGTLFTMLLLVFFQMFKILHKYCTTKTVIYTSCTTFCVTEDMHEMTAYTANT